MYNALYPLLVILLFGTQIANATRILDLPVVGVPAGNTASLDLTIDDVDRVASIYVQINYNPEVATFQSIAVPGSSLGEQVDAFSWDDDDGVLKIWLARDEPLPTGGGTLARLDFVVTPGSPNGLYSDLAIAEVDITDEMDIPLDLDGSANHDDGRVVSSDVAFIDTDGDGMPDNWETTYFLDPNVVSSQDDEDNDGVPNLIEFAFGMDPTIADLNNTPVMGVMQISGENYLTLNFRRLLNYPTIEYHVEAGPDLFNWEENDTWEYQSPLDNGDSLTETAYFRDLLSIDFYGKRFMRVRINSQ